MNTKTIRISALFAAFALPATAFGAGFQINEHNGKATGRAGAVVATVNDASAVFYNPAGLTQVESEQTIKSGIEAGLAEPRKVPSPQSQRGTHRGSVNNGVGSGDLQDLQAGTWRTFTPLPALMPRAPALSPDMAPAPLRAWLCDSAQRAQVSLESIAAPAIVGLSGMIAGKVGVLPKQHDPDFEARPRWPLDTTSAPRVGYGKRGAKV